MPPGWALAGCNGAAKRSTIVEKQKIHALTLANWPLPLIAFDSDLSVLRFLLVPTPSEKVLAARPYVCGQAGAEGEGGQGRKCRSGPKFLPCAWVPMPPGWALAGCNVAAKRSTIVETQTMPELIMAYWPFLLIAFAIGLAVSWFVLVASRRAKVLIERHD